MNLKEVYDCLKVNLSKVFGEEGFKYTGGKGGAKFKKTTPFGFVEIVYGVTNYSPVYTVTGLGYLIRFEAVENICSKFNQVVDESSEAGNQPTISGGYGGLVNIKHHDFGKVTTIQEVESVASEITSIYLEILRPYVTNHSDIQLVEREINEDTERDLPYTMYWRGRRAMRGIILAKLCSNPRYEELKMIYRQKCVEQDDKDVLEAYDSLVKYLDHEFKGALPS